MVLGIVVLLITATACGSTPRTASGENGPSAGGDTSALPTGLSEPFDLALVATSPDRFVLVDGGQADERPVAGATVYRIESGGSKVATSFSRPYRTPKAWVGADGAVVIVGMDCAENDDVGPSCARAPIVVAELNGDGTEQTWDTDIVTDASVGFAAGPLGEDGLVIVTLDPATREARVATIESLGAEPTEWGAVDLTLPAATLICPAGDRTYLFPADLADSSDGPGLFEVTENGVEPAGALRTAMGDLTAVSGCSADGEVLVSALADGMIERLLISLDEPETQYPLELEASFDTASVSLSAGGDLIAWRSVDEGTSGRPQWQLSRQADGSWVSIGTVTSYDPPAKTAVGPRSAATILRNSDGSTVAVLGG